SECLQSPAAAIRRSACNAARKKRVRSERIMILLTRLMLEDPDATVRREAVLGLRDFWQHAKPMTQEVWRAHRNDPDETVRSYARIVLQLLDEIE
ncbi:MAG: HEAT repeat domain-containing protein, partial [Planctomycetota bacterium]